MVDDSGQVLGNVSKVLDKPEALHFAVVMVKGKQFKVHYTPPAVQGTLYRLLPCASSPHHRCI